MNEVTGNEISIIKTAVRKRPKVHKIKPLRSRSYLSKHRHLNFLITKVTLYTGRLYIASFHNYLFKFISKYILKIIIIFFLNEKQRKHVRRHINIMTDIISTSYMYSLNFKVFFQL